MDLHRFFTAIPRAVVNHDDSAGTAPDPLVWSAGAPPKRRRLVHAVRNCSMLPRPAPTCVSGWVNVFPTAVSADDVNAWLCSVGMWAAFLGTLHWPSAGADLGAGGVSYVESLVLYELWVGERIVLEKALPSVS